MMADYICLRNDSTSSTTLIVRTSPVLAWLVSKKTSTCQSSTTRQRSQFFSWATYSCKFHRESVSLCKDCNRADISPVRNMLLNFMGKPSLYLPICMMIWGVMSILTGKSVLFGSYWCDVLSVRPRHHQEVKSPPLHRG